MAAVGPDEPLIIAHVERDGFEAVKRGARVKLPTPRPSILGDYLQQLCGRNGFAALTEAVAFSEEARASELQRPATTTTTPQRRSQLTVQHSSPITTAAQSRSQRNNETGPLARSLGPGCSGSKT